MALEKLEARDGSDIFPADDDTFTVARALIAKIRPLTAADDDVLQIALQAVTAPFREDGMEPADVIIAFAKALGSLLALCGVPDALAGQLLKRHNIAVLDYRQKSQEVLEAAFDPKRRN